MGKITIEPLSKERLEKTTEMIIKIFNNKPEDVDWPGKWLPASLEPEKYKKDFDAIDCLFCNYWVAIDSKSNRVAGIIGIYSIKHDEEEACWIGWFCVAPEFRERKIGSKLLDFAIEKAKSMKKEYLRLYISNNPNEKKAKILYARRGFKLLGKKKLKGFREKQLIMELKL